MTPHAILSISDQGEVVYVRVRSGRSGREYLVTSRHGAPDSCECVAGLHRQGYPCSHIRAAREYLHQLSRGQAESPRACPAPQPATTAAPAPPSNPFARLDARERAEQAAREAARPRVLTTAEQERLSLLFSER